MKRFYCILLLITSALAVNAKFDVNFFEFLA